jgi:hypothetical protein
MNPALPRFRLQFRFEYGAASCFRAANDEARRRFGREADLGRLPVSSATRERIEALQKRFEVILSPETPGLESHWRALEEELFRLEAAELCRDLARELGPDFALTDESAYPWAGNRPASRAEGAG